MPGAGPRVIRENTNYRGTALSSPGYGQVPASRQPMGPTPSYRPRSGVLASAGPGPQMTPAANRDVLAPYRKAMYLKKSHSKKEYRNDLEVIPENCDYVQVGGVEQKKKETFWQKTKSIFKSYDGEECGNMEGQVMNAQDQYKLDQKEYEHEQNMKLLRRQQSLQNPGYAPPAATLAARENNYDSAGYTFDNNNCDNTSNVFSYMPGAVNLEVAPGKDGRRATDTRNFAKQYRQPINAGGLGKKSGSFKRRGSNDGSSTASGKKFRWGSTKEYAVPRDDQSRENMTPKSPYFLNFKLQIKHVDLPGTIKMDKDDLFFLEVDIGELVPERRYDRDGHAKTLDEFTALYNGSTTEWQFATCEEPLPPIQSTPVPATHHTAGSGVTLDWNRGTYACWDIKNAQPGFINCKVFRLTRSKIKDFFKIKQADEKVLVGVAVVTITSEDARKGGKVDVNLSTATDNAPIGIVKALIHPLILDEEENEEIAHKPSMRTLDSADKAENAHEECVEETHETRMMKTLSMQSTQYAKPTASVIDDRRPDADSIHPNDSVSCDGYQSGHSRRLAEKAEEASRAMSNRAPARRASSRSGSSADEDRSRVMRYVNNVPQKKENLQKQTTSSKSEKKTSSEKRTSSSRNRNSSMERVEVVEVKKSTTINRIFKKQQSQSKTPAASAAQAAIEAGKMSNNRRSKNVGFEIEEVRSVSTVPLADAAIIHGTAAAAAATANAMPEIPDDYDDEDTTSFYSKSNHSGISHESSGMTPPQISPIAEPSDPGSRLGPPSVPYSQIFSSLKKMRRGLFKRIREVNPADIDGSELLGVKDSMLSLRRDLKPNPEFRRQSSNMSTDSDSVGPQDLLWQVRKIQRELFKIASHIRAKAVLRDVCCVAEALCSDLLIRDLQENQHGDDLKILDIDSNRAPCDSRGQQILICTKRFPQPIDQVLIGGVEAQISVACQRCAIVVVPPLNYDLACQLATGDSHAVDIEIRAVDRAIMAPQCIFYDSVPLQDLDEAYNSFSPDMEFSM